MRQLIILTFLIAGSASLALAQAPDEPPKNEFFAGYSYHSADINTLTIDPHRTGQNGINLAYTRNLTRHIGLTGDASAHFHRDTRGTGTGTFSTQRDQYFLLAGLQVQDWRYQPCAAVRACFVRSLAFQRVYFRHSTFG
ncbi:MAG TPA: hypothetical protein VJS64_09660 [Pyrinomonadaceae bacterium]|nr:hypothetical protein [Pyrinomonadaceae bacterium]